MLNLRARRKTLIILAVAFLAAAGAAMLPDNSYQRWQLLDGTIQQNARWIYERTNFDPTPIDVAVIGPSRTQAGINSVELESALKAAGAPAHVVNLSLAETGRDIGYVIARELFKTKKPKLLVIGVYEKPSRYGHPAFKYIAPNWLVADPGYVGNLNYFSNLVYLPYRQMQLFIADLWPSLMGLTKTFNPATYPGSNLDTTNNQHRMDGTLVNRTVPPPREKLTSEVQELEAGIRPPILPTVLRDVEFGDERHAIREIAALARESGTRILFVSLPYYSGPDTIQEEDFYRQFGDVINASFVADHPELYVDYAHLTAKGASVLTSWLAPYISKELSATP